MLRRHASASRATSAAANTAVGSSMHTAAAQALEAVSRGKGAGGAAPVSARNRAAKRSTIGPSRLSTCESNVACARAVVEACGVGCRRRGEAAVKAAVKVHHERRLSPIARRAPECGLGVQRLSHGGFDPSRPERRGHP
eukprot:scaffold11520_cov30-Phaeocystis_antarctica.AAC.1